MSSPELVSDSPVSSINEEKFDELPCAVNPFVPIKMTSTMYVPRIFHKLITKSGLEKELNCKFKFPSAKQKQILKITSESKDAIENAKVRITDLIAISRSKLRPTHFICLPVANDLTCGKFKFFKSKLLDKAKEDPLYSDIEEDLFVPEQKLHFTFITLLHADQKEVDQANEILASFKESEVGKAVFSQPLCITIRGLEVMQKNPKFSHVLYASVYPEGDFERLQFLANALANSYRQTDLVSGAIEDPESSKDGPPDVKLHMTLLNSRNRLERQLRRAGGNKAERRRIRRKAFNAEALLAEFKDFSFAENSSFDYIKLCRMHSSGYDSFYYTESEIKLGDQSIET